MKTFADLTFNTHPLGGEALQAKMEFQDGSMISAITGHDGFYCKMGSYEMMSSRSKGAGVRGHLSPEQITRHMIYIQKNPKN